jgi:hypothetical protein
MTVQIKSGSIKATSGLIGNPLRLSVSPAGRRSFFSPSRLSQLCSLVVSV